MSTHSWDLLNDAGIGGEEVVMLTPGGEKGTRVLRVSDDPEMRRQLKCGLTVAVAILPRTNPPQLKQLALFG